MKSLPTVSFETLTGRRWGVAPGLEPDRLGDELKSMFHGMASAPLPEKMMELALALDEAFHKGELHPESTRQFS